MTPYNIIKVGSNLHWTDTPGSNVYMNCNQSVASRSSASLVMLIWYISSQCASFYSVSIKVPHFSSAQLADTQQCRADLDVRSSLLWVCRYSSRRVTAVRLHLLTCGILAGYRTTPRPFQPPALSSLNPQSLSWAPPLLSEPLRTHNVTVCKENSQMLSPTSPQSI